MLFCISDAFRLGRYKVVAVECFRLNEDLGEKGIACSIVCGLDTLLQGKALRA